MKNKIKSEWKSLTTNSDKTFNLALLWITIALFIYCYFGTFSAFENFFPNVKDLPYWKIIYHNLCAFIIFFLFSLIYVKCFIKKKPYNFGLKKGNAKIGLIICAIATLVVPLVALSSVLDPAMCSTYPLIDFKVYSAWYYILLYFASYLLYYVGWEYLFRGLGLFSSMEKCSPLGAILITTLISALIHTSIGGFGKPMVETLSAIPAGLIFGFVTYKTKSIWYSFYIHAIVGIFTDIFIFLLV